MFFHTPATNEPRADTMRQTLKLFLLTLLSITLPAPDASAKFKGIVDMDLTLPNGTSDITYFFGEGKQRMDMHTELEKIPEPLKTTVITNASRPDEAIVVNHKAGTWARLNLRTAAENATLIDFDDDYRIEKKGTENIRGYLCRRVKLSSRTDTIEMWLTGDIGDFDTFRLLQSQNPRLSNTMLARKLSAGGLDGFPARIIQTNEGGRTVMEISSVRKTSPQRSTFSVPKGYREVADGRQPLDSKQKEHLKDLMEKMKNFEE